VGTLSSIKGAWIATWSGIRHAFKPRMTLRYPDQKLDLQGPGYRFDPKNGVGFPGFKGRHMLREDKCTGCQLCAIACDGVAVAIEMQTMVRNRPQNKKNIWPAVDYGRCVFCGLCVDACPFDALSMSNDYELSAYDKASLKYTPDMLMLPPPAELGTAKVKFDLKRGNVTHG
jgi:NADH-quinone oxidoreductase subunit I